MKKLIAPLALVLATACGTENLNADDFREGVPAPETARMDEPASEEGQALTLGPDAQAEGSVSAYYRFTRDETRRVNASVGLVLHLVHAITLRPPTSIEGDVAVWASIVPDALAMNVWQLTVTHLGGGEFEYVLEGRSRLSSDDAYVVVLSGTHERGPWRGFGRGNFLIDLDALGALPEHDARLTGTLEVSYDRPSDDAPATIAVDFDRALDLEAGLLLDAEYRYRREAQGGGELEFVVERDVDGGQAAERLAIKSRWTLEGAGRADVKASGGDLTREETVSECWDTSFASTYMAVSFTADSLYNYGVEATACVFASASFPNE